MRRTVEERPLRLPSRAGLLLFVIYVVGSLTLGERFPFSRFTMFSRVEANETVLIVRAAGRPVDPFFLSGFRGGLTVPPHESPGEWIIHEFIEATRERDIDPSLPDPPLDVEASVCTASTPDPGAAPKIDCEPFWRGKARRRWL